MRMSIGVVPAHRSAVLRHAGVAFPANTLIRSSGFLRSRKVTFNTPTYLAISVTANVLDYQVKY
jgi:hypothetical protein